MFNPIDNAHASRVHTLLVFFLQEVNKTYIQLKTIKELFISALRRQDRISNRG